MTDSEKRPRRKFTAEQKSEAVRLVKDVGNLSEVARDLDLCQSVLPGHLAEEDADGSG